MAREVRIYIAFLLPIIYTQPSVPYMRRLSLLLPPLVRVSSSLNFKSHLIPSNPRFSFPNPPYFSSFLNIYLNNHSNVYTRLVPYFTYPCQICSVGQLYAFASRTHAYTRIDCGKCRVFAIENAAYHLRFVTFILSSRHLSTFTSIFFSFSFFFFSLYPSLYIRIFSIIVLPTVPHIILSRLSV